MFRQLWRKAENVTFKELFDGDNPMAKAAAKPTDPAVLTANDILTGRVVWWDGASWSELFDAARVAVGDGERAALAAVAVLEEDGDRVVGASVIALDAGGTPKGLREGRRLLGPSIDLPGVEAEPWREAA